MVRVAGIDLLGLHALTGPCVAHVCMHTSAQICSSRHSFLVPSPHPHLSCVSRLHAPPPCTTPLHVINCS